MNFSVYFKVIKFTFLTYLTYPLEIVSYIFKYVIRVLFLLAFWNVVFSSSPVTDNLNLVAYFLLATSVSDINMADTGNLGRTIRKLVSRGGINQALVKPVNLVAFFYAQTLGSIGLKIALAFISLIVGLIISKPTSWVSIVLFIVFFIQSIAISFAYNLFEGALSLNFTEVSGIKNAMRHVTRVLSGQLVPLNFFPEAIKNILLLTPIPIMVYSPVNALSQNILNTEVYVQIFIGLFWSILLNILVYKYWLRSLKNYDAVGI